MEVANTGKNVYRNNYSRVIGKEEEEEQGELNGTGEA